MTDKYVTMVDNEIGRKVANSVANFVVEAGQHPSVAAEKCARFARGYPTPLKLRVMCHGIYGNGSPGIEIGPIHIGGTQKPGYGLWLGGQEYEANLIPTIFAPAYNCFDAVVMVVCGAAGRDPAAIPWGSGDGPGLCKAIAFTTNAPVWASDKEQLYTRPVFGSAVGLTSWRGNVWQFPAGGGEPTRMWT